MSSLIAAALRITTVQMLMNATSAGAMVFDSAIDPIDETIASEARPVITVATDDDDKDPEVRDLLGAQGTTDLVIEMAVARKVTVKVDGGTEEQIVVPGTDGGLEFIINMMGRQLQRAILAGGPWSDLWRSFVLSIPKVRTRRGADVKMGVRYAGRQWIITVSTINEPPFGPIESDTPWARLISMMEQTEELADLAKIMRAEIETPTLAGWRKVGADIGVNADVVRGLGLAPVDETASGDAAVATTGVAVPDDGSEPIEVTIEGA